ncbi:MAG: TRAP transporter TatT component family protein [Treponema sp.]|nr:TRAP transporter TatT component family protein [Treponema sp.]
MKVKFPVILAISCLITLGASCSINKMAINAVSNALTGSGSTDVFTGDSDPKLVGDALPFAIKMYEALLSQNPNHEGLLITTGSLFVMYANAFVQGPAEMLDSVDYYEERLAGLDRAKKLYLRGNDILLSAMEKKFPGFESASIQDGSLAAILSKCKKEDVPLLYWTAAGGLAAYSIDVFDFELGFNIPKWGALMGRAYELDPDYNNGAIDDFYIQYYAALPETLGGDKAKAETHFKLALEKTKGNSAGPYVSYARSICVPAQDYDAFKENLEKALAINPDDDPPNRLINIITQRKARYLLDTAYEYFSFIPYDDWGDY